MSLLCHRALPASTGSNELLANESQTRAPLSAGDEASFSPKATKAARGSRGSHLVNHMGQIHVRDGEDAGGWTARVLPATCRLIDAYGASWKGDSALLTHTGRIATPSLWGRGDRSWGRGRREHPSSSWDLLGTTQGCCIPGHQVAKVQPVPEGCPRLGAFLGRISLGWCARAAPRRVAAVGSPSQKRKCRTKEAPASAQQAAFETLPKRSPTHGSWATGKEKPAVLLDKAISAVTGPTGSPPAALSHPVCPLPDPRGPAHMSPPRGNDHSAQT